jgi:protein kinase C substrate 80K-H
LSQRGQNDYGKYNVLEPLHGKCFEIAVQQYTYKICPYDKASQIEKGRPTDLGKFDKYDSEKNEMHFHNGAKCWNGPKRSMTVTFECGAESRVFGVEEPEKCTYTMHFVTPAVCDEEHAQVLKMNLDAELGGDDEDQE